MFRQHKERCLPTDLELFLPEQFSLVLLPPSETVSLVGSVIVSRNPKIPFQIFDCPDNMQNCLKVNYFLFGFVLVLHSGTRKLDTPRLQTNAFRQSSVCTDKHGLTQFNLELIN